MEGLRERKKRQTREAIAAAAMALFHERGFDAVTVADVARAADVSEKTVFNYFPTKEDLVFHRGRGAPRRAHRGDPHAPARRARSSSRSARQTMAFLDRVEHGPVESIVAVPRLVRRQHRAARPAVPRLGAEAAVLAPVIAEETGARPDDLVAGRRRALAGVDAPARLPRRLQPPARGRGPARASPPTCATQARRAYDQLEHGLRDYGVR